MYYNLVLSQEEIEKIERGTIPIIDNGNKIVAYEWIDPYIKPKTYKEACDLLVAAGLFLEYSEKNKESRIKRLFSCLTKI